MEDREVYLTNGAPFVTETPPDDAEPTEEPVTSLCALDRLFDATGTVKVKVGTQTRTLPIQAVDLEQVEALCKPFRARPTVKRDQVGGKWVTIIDEANENYRDALARYNMLYTYVHACCGLAVDIRNAQREVVWSVDNRTHDVEQAIKALKDMGFVLNHAVTVNRAINELTAFVEERQLGE